MERETAAQGGIHGQVAIVTGGGRGLGRAFALALGSSGASVAVTARTTREVQETAELVQASGARCVAYTADVTDYAATNRIVADVERRLGPIGLLVNNAAVITPLAYEWDVDPDEWWRTMTINERGTYLWIRAVMPGMMARRRGRIINMSSGAIFSHHPYGTAYLASKAAIAVMTYNLAGALREHGISVFVLAPGGRSGMIEQLAHSPNVPEPVRERFRKVLTDESLDGTDSSAGVLLFLASGRADFLAGRYITRRDSPAELTRRSDEIAQKDLYLLRRDPPLPALAQIPSARYQS